MIMCLKMKVMGRVESFGVFSRKSLSCSQCPTPTLATQPCTGQQRWYKYSLTGFWGSKLSLAFGSSIERPFRCLYDIIVIMHSRRIITSCSARQCDNSDTADGARPHAGHWATGVKVIAGQLAWCRAAYGCTLICDAIGFELAEQRRIHPTSHCCHQPSQSGDAFNILHKRISLHEKEVCVKALIRPHVH